MTRSSSSSYCQLEHRTILNTSGSRQAAHCLTTAPAQAARSTAYTIAETFQRWPWRGTGRRPGTQLSLVTSGLAPHLCEEHSLWRAVKRVGKWLYTGTLSLQPVVITRPPSSILPVETKAGL
jgi:hypothetical protein